LAVWEGHKEVVRMLLDIGHADVNQPWGIELRDNNTAIMD